jgi:hypothetical protein
LRWVQVFADLTYLQVDDDYSSNEGYKEDTIERADVINIGGFLDTNDNGPFSYDGVTIDEAKGSSAPME